MAFEVSVYRVERKVSADNWNAVVCENLAILRADLSRLRIVLIAYKFLSVWEGYCNDLYALIVGLSKILLDS